MSAITSGVTAGGSLALAHHILSFASQPRLDPGFFCAAPEQGFLLEVLLPWHWHWHFALLVGRVCGDLKVGCGALGWCLDCYLQFGGPCWTEAFVPDPFMSSEQQNLINELREELAVLREDFEALQAEVTRLRRALAGLRAGTGSLRERSSQEDLEDSRSSLRRSPGSDSRDSRGPLGSRLQPLLLCTW